MPNTINISYVYLQHYSTFIIEPRSNKNSCKLPLAELQTKPARPKTSLLKKYSLRTITSYQYLVQKTPMNVSLISYHLPHVPHIPQEGGTANARGRAFKGMSRRRRYLRRKLWGSKIWFHISKDAGHTTDRSSDTEACKALEAVGSKMLHRFFLEKKQGYLLPSLEFSEWQAFWCTFLENVSTLRNVSERAYTRHVSRNRGGTHTQPPLAFSD